MVDCPFCEIEHGRVISENQYAYCIRDDEPVTHLHSLVIPKRHVESLFDLEQSEILAIHGLLLEERDEIEKMDAGVSGFNIGMNIGNVAGQSVFHCHYHLIPRRQGDVANPKGGVKNLIRVNE